MTASGQQSGSFGWLITDFVRRVPGAARVGGEQTDWKGVLVASIAAILMITGMKFWSAVVPPPKMAAGEPELIKPRPLVVRAAPPKKDDTRVLDAQKVNQARRDPGKAVARHMGQKGEAGSKTAPLRFHVKRLRMKPSLNSEPASARTQPAPRIARMPTLLATIANGSLTLSAVGSDDTEKPVVGWRRWR